MAEIFTHIEAFDCLPFDNELATAEVLQKFIESQNENVFRFSKDFQSDEDSKLAEYDYRSYCWKAGRFVGEAIIKHKGDIYKITIKPRFGEKLLLRMLEEIFNIQITKSASVQNKSLDWQHYIKRIIAFVWLQKLANANLHGVPKTQIKKQQKGQTIRGRLDVRKSTKPLYQNDEIVSTFREKQIDKLIGQIIYQAYQILKTDFEIGKINIPDSAQDAINQIQSSIQNKEYISENDYKNIRYKEIYLSWKTVVDLSWDIIKRKHFSLKQDKAKKGFGFFIDMAEVWEQYLRALLKKNLLPYGWYYKKDKQIAYKGYFFQRELIPDLVFQKGNEVAVWDAKYKRMEGRFFDVDRSDFFQIHTYLQFQVNDKILKAGGLLYPLSTSPNFDNYQSPNLLNEFGVKMKYTIDGIEVKEMSEQENILQKEMEFVKRIISHIDN
jgi:5-methylcytosine-specific restriction enzyme subunit McrC